VRQATWNINAVQPTASDARVIADWHNAEGQPTGHPALLLSQRGAFLTHIVLGDDREGKKQMLAAILGYLDSSLWHDMAQAAMGRIGHVGHLHSFRDVHDHVEANGDADAIEFLSASAQSTAKARDLLATASKDPHEYPAGMIAAREAHELLVKAFLRAQPSPQIEGRAVWNHSGTGAYPGDWERSARELAEAGFNMVFPNMLWAGRAHYPSDVLPRSRTFDQYGDQIAQCIEACRRHGLEVHVWKVNHNLSGAPREFVEKLRREGRTQVAADGEPYDWLCPSHPDNFELELKSMLEVAEKYDVDGLHFDYIRYPGSQCCYCDGCRARFEAEAGRKVADWPADCRSGKLREIYNDWRCANITRLVAAVHQDAKAIKPEIKISAAVFGSYPACRDSVAQDWVAWVKAGYLDFVCPMDYTESDPFFRSLVERQMELVENRIPMYPGIGATASRSSLTGDRVVGQIHHARTLGAAGFTIFNFQQDTATSLLPGIGAGAGRKRAVPPHRNR
jgi:uncharacterized lipoprotein YddW (UPF0748 family)